MRAVGRSVLALGAVAAGLAMGISSAGAAQPSRQTRLPLIGYVLAYETNKLDRLDPATDRMLRPITLSRAPDAMAIAPGGRTAYVLTTYSAVWAVNLVTGKAVKVQGVGPYPYEVAFSPGGGTAYVLTRRAVIAIDVATRQVLKRIPVAETADGALIQVAPRGHALFVLNIGTEDVIEVSTATNTVLRQVHLVGCCYAPGVYSPDGHWLYLQDDAGLVAINTISGAVSTPVPLGESDLGSLLLAPGGKALYAPGSDSRNGTTVTRINLAGGQMTPTWTTMVDPEGGGMTMAYAPDGSTLYVTTALRRSVLPVSTATGAADPPIADHLAGWQLVIGGSGRYLFATSLEGAVAVINTATNSLVRTLHEGDRADRFVSLVAGPGARQVFAVVSAGWLVPISSADGLAGRRIPVDGQPGHIVFGR